MKKINDFLKIIFFSLIFLIALTLILYIDNLMYGFFLIIMLMRIVLMMSLVSYTNDEEINNGKEGYYSQYGTSFGMNAEKHIEYVNKQRQFTEEQVANKIMNKK